MKQHKHLTINHIALANLTKKKKQYGIMFLGIFLAMLFSTSMILFLFGVSENELLVSERKFGRHDITIYGPKETPEDAFKALQKDGTIEEYGLVYTIGYVYPNAENEAHGTSIAWLDDTAKKMYCDMKDGCYPTEESEIAVEESMFFQLGIEPKLNTTVELMLKPQNDMDYIEPIQKTYTVVGILEDKYMNRRNNYQSSDDYLVPTVFVADGTQTELGGKELVSAFAKTNEHSEKVHFKLTQRDDIQFRNVTSTDQFREKGTLDQMLAMSSRYSYEAVSIVCAFLILAACVMIINAFMTNINDRKKQIGMLRAVGATKRQLILLFSREACFLAVLAIPLSLLCSFLLVKIVLHVLYPVVSLKHSVPVLLGSAVFGFLLTMCAAMLPILAATRISPMQAIRNTEAARRAKKHKIKSQKSFVPEKLFAKRSDMFYKGGKITVSIIVALVVLLSSLSFTLAGFSLRDNPAPKNTNYDIRYLDHDYAGISSYFCHQKAGISETDKQDMTNLPYVKQVRGMKACNVILEFPALTEYVRILNENLNNPHDHTAMGEHMISLDEFKKRVVSKTTRNYDDIKNAMGLSEAYTNMKLDSFDESVLQSYTSLVSAGKIDIDAINSGEKVVLVLPLTAKEYVKINSKNHAVSHLICYDEDRFGGKYKEKDKVLEGEIPFEIGDTITLKMITAPADAAPKQETGFVIGSITNGYDYSKKTVITKEVKIGAIIKPYAFYDTSDVISPDTSVCILTTHTGMEKFSNQPKYQHVFVEHNAGVDAEKNEYLKELLNPFAEKYDSYLNSPYENYKRIKEENQRLILLAASILLVTLAIVSSIINNIMNASIRDNKKTIGTLRAVGASKKELISAYVRRLLSMILSGTIGGFAAYTVVFGLWLLYLSLDSHREYMLLLKSFNPYISLVFLVLLLSICSINLYVRIKKEMQNSIVENIREL